MEKVTEASSVNHVYVTNPFPCAPHGRITWRHPGPLLRLAVAAIVWAFVGVPGLYSQTSKPTEYEVKAAYLFNFGRFVEWPAKVRAAKVESFPICVLGRDPFGAILDASIAGETIDAKNVVAKRISRPQDAVNCRVLFISSSEESQLKEIVAALDTAGVLTVSDMPEFARRGGMVQFVLEANRVRFEVNLAATERTGLTLSSQLLKLAIRVRRSSQIGD